MSTPAQADPSPAPPKKRWIISALGIMQIFAWGSTFYLPAILAAPIAADTGWSLTWIVGSLSMGLVVAGLVSPRVGIAIDRFGGRRLLSLSCVLLAIGLLLVGSAAALWVYMAGWLILGIGMGAGLYDAAFATLGQIYGLKARSAITALTLWGGFASTICWPLTAWLLEQSGWRGTCFVYAGIMLFICLPLLRLTLPAKQQPIAKIDLPAPVPFVFTHLENRQMRLVMFTLIISGAIGALVSVHLLLLLSGRGLSMEDAVMLGALIGPAQVAGRLLEAANRERHHPLWTLTIAVSLTASGLVLLASGASLPALALILYGAGNGIFSIAKGALPLFLFGVERYARIMGRLARPSMLAQAIAPAMVAWLLAGNGAQPLALLLTVLAALNIVVVFQLWRLRLSGAHANS